MSENQLAHQLCPDDCYADKADVYAQLHYKDTYFLFVECLENYFHSVWQYSARDQLKALDYGCGAGHSMQLMKRFGFNKMIGIDPSEPMIKKAREVDPGGDYRLITGDFDWSLFKNYFDLVSSFFVLPALSNTQIVEKYLANAATILKEGGTFIIVTTSPEALSPAYTWLSWDQDFPENHRLHNGSPARILLKEQGLMLEDTFWAREYLERSFQLHSFTIDHLFQPVGRDDDCYPWASEKDTSPFYIYVLKRSF
ncbi:MAG: class I SAM-dependent methyltransferase [Caedimonas sp.]|nr:class I SAM-dependent methyltransferase [Caedimonas sp.]